MANYYATARSNYFRVKDAEAFETLIEGFGDVSTWTKEVAGETFYAMAADRGDCGGWPSSKYIEDDDDYIEVDFAEHVAAHLIDGDVLVLMETGAEKLRYVSAYALAINNKLESRALGLSDIYVQARELGDSITDASY